MITRIAELRRKNGLTQQQLASEINVSQETISAYERNGITPSAQVLVLMSQFFGVSTDYILKLSDKPLIDSPEALTDSELDWLALYRQMDERAKLQARGYIQGLLAQLEREKL
ncbi:MAG: helix-turn-helix transcriptional regulator [Eubacteriales bacterium]|nr:helix-turn-helix transcriptional regulator [Eubacteriales bacterium]